MKMTKPLILAGALLVLGVSAEPVPKSPNPHRFKGAGYDVGPGATGWERKHGLMPGGTRFVYDAPINATELAVREKRQMGCEKLRGLFIRPCQVVDHQDGGPVSTTDTRYYDAQGGYELDRTYYIGDESCTPGSSDIFYKLNLHGQVLYHGQSPDSVQIDDSHWGEVCAAEMAWTKSTLILGDNDRGQYMANLIQQNCPCGNKWAAPGTFDTDPDSCTEKDKASTVYVCKLITGGHDYFNYAVSTDGLEYATSQDSFGGKDPKDQYFKNKVDVGYVREKITEGMNHNPSTCVGALKNDPCHPTSPGARPGCACLDKAQGACQTCVGLECDGCVLRELDPKFDPYNDNNIWHACCPCIYAYEEAFDPNWDDIITNVRC